MKTADKRAAYWVKRYRKERNMTQAVLADKINSTRVSVNYWESGRNSISLNRLEAVAHALCVDITLFFQAIPED